MKRAPSFRRLFQLSDSFYQMSNLFGNVSNFNLPNLLCGGNNVGVCQPNQACTFTDPQYSQGNCCSYCEYHPFWPGCDMGGNVSNICGDCSLLDICPPIN